jgi:toxin YxiD
LPDQEPGVIKSPAEESRGQKHAEEGVLNRFVKAIKAKYPKLKPVQVDGVDTYPQVKGTFYLHQSNPKGICSTCIQGIKPQIPPIEAGVFMQASRMLPNVDFVASTENVPGVTAVRGARLSFTLRNGKYVNGQ